MKSEEKKTPAPPVTNDRMAGGKKAPSPKQADEKADESKKKATASPAKVPKPKTGITMDQTRMESLGQLTSPLNGGLGSDMWADTPRSIVMDLLPQMPSGSTLMPVQLLARRVLLTNGDAGLMRDNSRSSSDPDIFTLRIEKLLDIGAYRDAADLYTLIEGEPSNDRLSRAGILSLLHNGMPAQACLEARVAKRDTPAADTPETAADPQNFWPQIDAVCMFVQAQSLKTAGNAASKYAGTKNVEKSAVTGVPGSRILTLLVSRPGYRYNVGSPEDILELPSFERAVLHGLGRFDYSRFKLRRLETIPARVLMIMATDENLPALRQIELNAEAARRGIITPGQLGKLYLSIAKKSQGAAPELAAGLPGRYAAFSGTEKTSEKAQIAKALLAGSDGSETGAAAMLPFASALSSIDPADLDKNMLDKVLTLMLRAGIVPPETWVKTWLGAESGDSSKSRNQTILYLANLLPENLPTESVPFSDEHLKPLFAPPESPQSIEIYAFFSGLGRVDALHNVLSDDVYEKHLDLTVPNDYVMPSSSLSEKLRESTSSGRIGETALLATVALKDYAPGKTHPGILRDVLKSLETVGLKEEALHIALEAVLSSKQ